MKIQLQRRFFMKTKVQREELSQNFNFMSKKNVCSPSSKYSSKYVRISESFSLCILKKGSLTVEAALIIPFFLTLLLAFFSLFLQYTLAAELKVQAAAEAKKLGVVRSFMDGEEGEDLTIYKTQKAEQLWQIPFIGNRYVTEKAVCRAWIGFTELEIEETYVYITPEGSVYHLFRDCTHLDLSIQQVSYEKALISKNEYGEVYGKCKLCREPCGMLVYITKEGNCYHSERSCSGLKRTVRQVAMSQVQGRSCCIRCSERKS